MSDWMKEARAKARELDQSRSQSPYKERLRVVGEQSKRKTLPWKNVGEEPKIKTLPMDSNTKTEIVLRSNMKTDLNKLKRSSSDGQEAQNVPTARGAANPNYAQNRNGSQLTEQQTAGTISGTSVGANNYLLSDNLRTAGEQLKSDVNARLVTDGEFANAAVEKLRENGQPEIADNLKSQLDALERERHIAELGAKQAEKEQQIPIPKPIFPQSSTSQFASPGVKEIGDNLITRYNAQAMQGYLGSREYAHKQETARKRAQSAAESIYQEMLDYIASPDVNALDDPKILDYRNRYYAALMESVPSETQEWGTEQYLDILATGGESLMNVIKELSKERERTYSRNPTTSVGFDEANAYFNRYNQLKKKYGDVLDDWLTYADHVRNGENAESKLADWTQFGRDKSDFRTWNTSVGFGLGSYAGYIDAWGQKLTNAITGKDYPIDYNTPAQMPAKISQAIRSGSTEDKSGFGRFLYNSTASIADSTIPLAFGGAGKAILALSGATNYMQAAAERGVPDDQALFIGVVCGLTDMAIEKLGFDRIFGTKSAGTLADDIIGIFDNAGLEALDDGAATLFITAADALIAGDKSEINTEIKNYMEEGYSYNEAADLARKNWVNGLALDMVGGYFSGAALSAGKVGFNAVTGKYKTNKANGLDVDGVKGPAAEISIPPEQFKQMQIDYAKEHGWKTDWDELEQVFFRMGLEMGYGDGLDVNNGQGGELHLSREQVKELSDMYNEGVYQLFRDVLKENAPSTLEEFSQIRYDNGDAWQQLKKQYEVVERYETRGDVPVDQIVELDEIAYHNKTEAFDYSKFHGDDRGKIKKLCKSGNAAVMTLDGKIYFSHSTVETQGTMAYDSYVGEHPLVGFSNKRIFKTLDLKDGVLRQYDTEAKFLEYVASIKTDRSEAFEVTILSEKHICKSCEYVVEQFKKLFPNATVNIVSGNPNYGDVNSKGEHGMKTWQHRKD